MKTLIYLGLNFLSRALFSQHERALAVIYVRVSPSAAYQNLTKSIPSCRLPKSSKKYPLMPPTKVSPPAAYIATSVSPHAAFWKSV